MERTDTAGCSAAAHCTNFVMRSAIFEKANFVRLEMCNLELHTIERQRLRMKTKIMTMHEHIYVKTMT